MSIPGANLRNHPKVSDSFIEGARERIAEATVTEKPKPTNDTSQH